MNPLAKFVGALVVAVALLFTLNPFIAGALVLCELLALPFAGVPFPRLMRLLWPVALAAFFAALTTALYGRPAGEVFFAWGPISVSQGSLYLSAAIGLRVLAIGLPGVVLFASVDPTDLADSLAQLWRLPPRFVFAALAALRQVDVLVDDWAMISRARRARGIGSGRGPLSASAGLASRIFALLVLALRRGSTLATAMDARGFSASTPRSYARTATWRRRDTLFVSAAILVGCLVVGASILLGGSGGGGVV